MGHLQNPVGGNPYAEVVTADFCLQPPGDTPTRSHFYLSVMAGCIPVIFDFECTSRAWNKKHSLGKGVDYSNMETSWAWRHSYNHLNYSDFTVAYNVSGGHNSVKELHTFIQSLIDMPSKRPGTCPPPRLSRTRVKRVLGGALRDCNESEDDSAHHSTT